LNNNIKEKKTVMITKEMKTQTIESHRIHEKDTGSPEIQIALITKRIDSLTDHFKAHTKDFNSRVGLLKLVGKRKDLLTYLRKKDFDRYSKIIKSLGLRK
jgi:small subunit ribosomal protein S15